MADLFGTEELEIKIKVLTVNGKRLNKTIINQLLEENIYQLRKQNGDDWVNDVRVFGNPLGFIKIEDDSRHTTKYMLLWEKSGKLRKCEHRLLFLENEDGRFTKEEFELLKPIINAPHLFYGA